MSQAVFEFEDYKAYLLKRLADKNNGGGHGARGRLSRAIGVPPSYTAQVLNGAAHFSLDQAEAINDFLGHAEDESSYFLFLLQFCRAGTARLRERLKKEMHRIRQAQLVLKNRLQVQQPLTELQQMTFYSSWQYSAIHALVSVPGFETPTAIARHFGMEITRVAEALRFLESVGLVIQEKGAYRIGSASTYLGSDSPLISKHHANWRLQAIQSLDHHSESDDLHYSSVVSLSDQDARRIREMIVELLKSSKSIIKTSSPEGIRCLSVDLFQV